ncbi:hypothetical protein P4O66_000715 [Electrophorus voltai]|uniref:Uncharacterized protein n=1 Tax=Electrophorus voltai TaxID=2609070 RepID=A0AAD8ZEV3_9TELE|nr:hypothetical protein P4O66_000715 [Electrophorus voltai]
MSSNGKPLSGSAGMGAPLGAFPVPPYPYFFPHMLGGLSPSPLPTLPETCIGTSVPKPAHVGCRTSARTESFLQFSTSPARVQQGPLADPHVTLYPPPSTGRSHDQESSLHPGALSLLREDHSRLCSAPVIERSASRVRAVLKEQEGRGVRPQRPPPAAPRRSV